MFCYTAKCLTHPLFRSPSGLPLTFSALFLLSIGEKFSTDVEVCCDP